MQDDAGNVGIGTTGPAQKLDVNGTVEANAITVNGNTVWHAGNMGYSARVYHSVDQNVPHNSWTRLYFNSERWDQDSYHSTASNTDRFTANETGTYLINLQIQFGGNATAVGSRNLKLLLNGTTIIAQRSYAAIGYDNIFISTIYQLSAGDFVVAEAWQNSGITLKVGASASYSPEYMIVKLGN